MESIAQAAQGPPRITRRDLLRGTVAGGIAMFLAACAPGPSPTPPPSPAVPSPSATPPSATASPGTSSVSSAAPSTPSPIDLRRRIAGLLVVGFRGATLDEAPWVRAALADAGLGGVILFDRDQLTGRSRNVVAPAQVVRLTTDLRAAARDRAILVGVDQEGGVVTRLGPANGYPAVASEATIGTGTAAQARTWATRIARVLAEAGIGLNFAPVVDLDVNPSSPAIGALGRSFSADPDVVVRMATIEVDAHRAAGVLTTLKHFPGIGSSTTNTDDGVADVTRTWSRVELEPFRRLVAAGEADLVMVGHVVNGQLDRGRPASLSRAVVTDLLRGELGWDGVVVTDDLQAKAIDDAFGRDEAILLALEAGSDLLLFANQAVYDPDIVDRVTGVVAGAVAAGRLDEARIDASWERVQRLFGGVTG